MNDPETRILDVAASEVRMETNADGKPLIKGIALRYGSLSKTLRDPKGRPFKERFTPGAFSRALATGADVRMLVNHDRNLIMGRNTAGTLRIFDEPDALRFEYDPPDTMLAQHYTNAVNRRDMNGVSFRFYKKADRWDGAGDATVRTVSEADIDDISIVTDAAYGDTFAEATVRSLDDHCRSQARHESWSPRAWLRMRLAEADL